MRITCESCSATFVAPDDKIRGRIAKYRCRKCGTTLVADGRGLAIDAPEDPTEVMSADAMLGGGDALSPSLRPGKPDTAPPPAVTPAPPKAATSPRPPAVAPKPATTAPKPTTGAPKPTAGAPKPTAGGPPRPKMPSSPPRPPSMPAPAEVRKKMPSVAPPPLPVEARKKMPSVAPPPLPVESEHAPVSVSELVTMDEPPAPPALPEKPKRPVPRDASASFSLGAPDTEAPVARRRPPKPATSGPDAPPPVLSEPLGIVTEGKPSGLVDLQKLSEPGGIPEPPPSSGHVSFDALMGEPPPPALAPPPRALAPPPVVVDEAPVLFSLPPDPPEEQRRPPVPKRVEAVPTPEPLPLVRTPVSVRPASIAPEARRKPYVLYALAAAALGGGLFFLGQLSAKSDAPTKPEPPTAAKTAETRAPDPTPPATTDRTTTAPTASATTSARPVVVDAGPAPVRPDDTRPTDPKPEPKSDPKPAEPKADAKPEPKPDEAKPVTPPTPPPPAEGAEFNKDAARAALNAAAGGAASCKQEDGPVGPARVKVTFSTTGRSTQAIIDGPPFAGTAVGSCIAQKFRGLSIPPFTGDPVTVTKTLTIQ
jgi:predicted Zn finger-like uncharacterized protein